jgi:hypothetical protein
MALLLKNSLVGAIPNEVARVGRMYGFDCQLEMESQSLSIVVQIGRMCDDRVAYQLYISPSDDLIEVLKDHLSTAHKIIRSGTNNGITHS